MQPCVISRTAAPPLAFAIEASRLFGLPLVAESHAARSTVSIAASMERLELDGSFATTADCAVHGRPPYVDLDAGLAQLRRA